MGNKQELCISTLTNSNGYENTQYSSSYVHYTLKNH